MAASLLKPRFALGPVLKPSYPKPPAPPGSLGYGDSCFHAQCTLENDAKIRLAKFSGYDKTLGIIEEVENACRLHAGKHRGSSCTQTRLTFLQHKRECSGQLYFEFSDPAYKSL